MIDVVMPKFGWTMEDGTIAEWYVGVGEHVKAGEILFAVETEKVQTDVESPATGTLAEVLYDDGAEVVVGEVVARIRPE